MSGDLSATAFRRVVAVATLLGVLLRLVDLGGTSFNPDEAFSAWVVATPARLFEVQSQDNHPPLWYAFLLVWTRLVGDGDVAVRLTSVLAGAVYVPLLGLAGRMLFDSRTGAWAAMLAAVWPLVVAQQRVARMYAWLPPVATLALIALVIALRGRQLRGWLVLGIALGALIDLHYVGITLALGLLTGALLHSAVALAVRRACGGHSRSRRVPSFVNLQFFVGRYVGTSRGIGPGSFLRLWDGLTVGDLFGVDPALMVLGSVLAARPSRSARRVSAAGLECSSRSPSLPERSRWGLPR